MTKQVVAELPTGTQFSQDHLGGVFVMRHVEITCLWSKMTQRQAMILCNSRKVIGHQLTVTEIWLGLNWLRLTEILIVQSFSNDDVTPLSKY